jgi:hypothetical protein
VSLLSVIPDARGASRDRRPFISSPASRGAGNPGVWLYTTSPSGATSRSRRPLNLSQNCGIWSRFRAGVGRQRLERSVESFHGRPRKFEKTQPNNGCGKDPKHGAGTGLAPRLAPNRISISAASTRLTGVTGPSISVASQSRLCARLLLAWASVPLGAIAKKQSRILAN